MKVLVTSSLVLALSLVLASTVDTSVLIRVILISTMILSVLAVYLIGKIPTKKPVNQRLHRHGPVVSFELRFILFLKGDRGLYYLPNGQIVEGMDPELHQKARKCFLKNPELFIEEREAGRLLRSEKEMPAVLPGDFKMQLSFKFHYQPEMSDDGEMISPFEFEDGKQFRTTDYKRLISSVQSVLKCRPELIGQELKSGRLTAVAPSIEKN